MFAGLGRENARPRVAVTTDQELRGSNPFGCTTRGKGLAQNAGPDKASGAHRGHGRHDLAVEAKAAWTGNAFGRRLAKPSILMPRPRLKIRVSAVQTRIWAPIESRLYGDSSRTADSSGNRLAIRKNHR